MDSVQIALGGGGLEHLAFLFVIGHWFEGQVGVIMACRVFANTSIDKTHACVERDPLKLLAQEPRIFLRVKDQRIFYRQARAAVSP